jgi:hypothetical protein
MSLASLHLPTPWLRRVLAFDALTGVATAALHLAFAPVLSTGLGLSEGLLNASAVGVLAFVALATTLARQPQPARGGVLAMVLLNLLWGVACLALAWGTTGVTPLGQSYLTVMAVAVFVLADLEFLGWRAPALQLAV